MKFCPFCGVSLLEGAVSFCVECGEALPSMKPEEPFVEEVFEPQKQKRQQRKLRWKRPKKAERCSVVEDELAEEIIEDDGYDGYYDDVQPQDDGYLSSGVDREQLRQIIGVGGGAVVIIAALILLMRFL